MDIDQEIDLFPTTKEILENEGEGYVPEIDWYPNELNPTTKRIEEYQKYALLASKLKAFDPFVKGFGFTIATLPATQLQFKMLQKRFEEKYKASIDKEFAINAELDLYKDYTQPGFMEKKDKSPAELGYYWAMSGGERFIKEFYLKEDSIFSDPQYPKNTRPISLKDIFWHWLTIRGSVMQAVKGHADARYVNYLQEIKENGKIPVPVFSLSDLYGDDPFGLLISEPIEKEKENDPESFCFSIDFIPEIAKLYKPSLGDIDFTKVEPEKLTKNYEVFKRFIEAVKPIKCFQQFFSEFNYTIGNHPETQRFYGELINQFNVKLSDALDKTFLINTELERYKLYTNKTSLGRLQDRDFTSKAFFWAQSGDTKDIKIFYLYLSHLEEYYAPDHCQYPIDLDSLYKSWVKIQSNLLQASRGHAYALYVNFLNQAQKSLKEESATPEEKNGSQDVAIKQKLVWRGAKNQLYAVLRQLKIDHELIGNSYENLADFLIQSVTGFETSKKETILPEMKKTKTLPKNKRISINPNIPD